MHHADVLAHHALRTTRNRPSSNDQYCRAAKATLARLDAQRTMRRRIVAVLAVIDVACIAFAFATSTGII